MLHCNTMPDWFWKSHSPCIERDVSGVLAFLNYIYWSTLTVMDQYLEQVWVECISIWSCLLTVVTSDSKWLHIHNVCKHPTPKTSSETPAKWDWLWSTLFSKRNATFLKEPFFWRRVYASQPGVIHHVDNAHGDNLPKTLFNKIIKTLCQGQWPRGSRKNGQINVAFLLEKGVWLSWDCKGFFWSLEYTTTVSALFSKGKVIGL